MRCAEAAGDEITDLLVASATGCRESFGRLYELTSARLFGVVVRLNRDRGEAEEVLQDVYVKVWFQRGQFDAGKGQAMQWLLSIAHRSAIDSLRRRACRPQLVQAVAGENDDPYERFAAIDAGPLEACMLRRRAQAVRACLDGLPAQQRTSLTLAFYDGLSSPEIAQRLGRPLGTVKSWMHRSLDALRQPLAGL
ncbi:sigma-70 family RNA polymerase sigma factor [soil metagenome]